ncbi:MAG: hypothetical protein LCH37_14810 [Bacteroidetes bacterium]|nr:hypothetical protein [Bacteroidota bacterium]
MSNKILIGTGFLLAAFLIVSTTTRAQSLEQKFKLITGTPSNFTISGGNLRFNAPVSIVNQSAFDITIRNLFVNISYQDSSGVWQDLFFQPNAVSQVTFAKGTTTNLNTIPLQMPLTNVFTIVQMMAGKIGATLKVTTRFEVSGIAAPAIETTIDAKSYIQPLITLLQKYGLINTGGKVSGIENTGLITGLTGLGYSANSFHERQIKDASKYAHLITKADGRETTIRKTSGTAYDTIDDMAKIVGETTYQTKELAKVLQGKTTEESVRNVWTWLHDHIQYRKDKDGVEQLREPAASFAHRQTGIDCDCFAIFASSLLTNMGITHYIEMCQIRPNPYFVHVYVVVPKEPELSLANRNNYWVVDACLHSFDELAKNISIKYSKKMITTRLSGLDACNCMANPKAEFGKAAKSSQKQAGFISPDELRKLELQALEPLRQTLIRTKNEAIANPAKVALMYNPGNLVKSIDYALQNWNDSAKRSQALDILAKQDKAITNQAAINGLAGLGAFEGLHGLAGYVDPTLQYPLLGVSGDGSLYIEGLGGLFDSVKKAAQSVSKVVTNTANKAVTALKSAGTATVNQVKAAATSVANTAKQAATFVANNAMKVFPLAVVARTAYRGLVALNFRGFATDLAKAISTPAGEKKLKDFWTGSYVGGNWGDLISAINAGKTKKPLLNGFEGLGGEPVSTASSVAAATPLIVKITNVIKEALSFADKTSKVAETVQKVQSTVQQVNNTAQVVKSIVPAPIAQKAAQVVENVATNYTAAVSPAVANQIVIPGFDPNVQTRENPSIPAPAEYQQAYMTNTNTANSGNMGNGLLYAAGAALVALLAISFSGGGTNKKNLSGVPEIAI